MPHTVTFKPSAAAAIEDVPKDVSKRIVRKLAALVDQPRPHGSIKLTGQNAYRLRVGDWRAIYEIDDAMRQVLVTVIAHRRESYR
jgi:mRNA interferase RelE/StbE